LTIFLLKTHFTLVSLYNQCNMYRVFGILYWLCL